MKRLGISIYPEHSTLEQDKGYIDLAHKYGFSRIFTCLLSVNGEKEEILQNFKETISYARSKNFEVTVDIAPRIFDELGISYDDLSFFAEMGAHGIRLDVGFTGKEEALMTYNPYGLKIEINMSNATKYMENILSHVPNRDLLVGCHNFYPKRFSGLSYDFFVKCSKMYKENYIQTAAFVNSHDATYDPWPVMEGLATLEMHRDLPIEVQAQHLSATGLIDDIIIGNAYASEAEIQKLAALNRQMMTFGIELDEAITELERVIVEEEPHFYRGDISEYMIRSTQSRVKYKSEAFPKGNTRDIRRGDIIIENETYGQYKGELNIALKDMKNSGKTNVVARIREEEIFLLNYLQAWENFQFQVKG